MANLDDFFSKKDKKKKGKKFVTANTDVLATKLEEAARKELEAELKANTIPMGESGPGIDSNQEGLDEEWAIYEEKKKDYSGLKIESLKIEENHNNGDDNDGEDENGEKGRKKKADGGPWSKVIQGNQDSNKEDSDDSRPATPEVKVPEAPAASQKSAYLPPHLRGGSASSSAPSPSSQAASKGPRRNKAAPDISNEFNFPSLASAAADTPAKATERAREGATFERVKAGGGQQHVKSADGPKLSLDNKYAALRGEH